MKTLLMLALVAGCATTQPRPAGPSVTVLTHEVRVCLDGRPLRVGEQLQFVRRVCRPMTPKIVAPVCASESIEGVEVVAVLDERCAIVRTRLDNPLQPGDQLELATR